MYRPTSFSALKGRLHMRNHVRKHLCSSYLQDGYRCSFNVDSKVMFAVARSSAALSEIVDVVRRLLAAKMQGMFMN
jgi:hypothetical protein